MTLAVAAFYHFADLPDAAVLRAPLLDLCRDHGIKGTVLLAPEGINATVAGEGAAIDAFLTALIDGPLFGGRLAPLTAKRSTAAAPPFARMKVRLKREIVTLGQPVDPHAGGGAFVEPADWNALIAHPDVVVVDTRNGFEVAMGTFPGALDPRLGRFGDFPAFADDQLHPLRDRPIALFCTGGIRCEKASAYLVAQGYPAVYQLRGGILRYLETVPAADSRWTGRCFIFDGRGALGHGLCEAPHP